MANRPSKTKPSKKSTNPNSSGRRQAGVGGGNRPARAHRDDTGEARQQQERTAKTHPRKNTGAQAAARKDK
jgi:hypothetical protein